MTFPDESLACSLWIFSRYILYESKIYSLLVIFFLTAGHKGGKMGDSAPRSGVSQEDWGVGTGKALPCRNHPF